MSRTDDIINVAGHRLSTGAIEEVLAEHNDVAECAVLGIADKLKGQLPIGLLALKAGVTKDKKEIISECIKMVRDKVGPVAAFKIAIVVKRLPKTRSGKILRGTVRKIADNEPYKMPATIDDPAILDERVDEVRQDNDNWYVKTNNNNEFISPNIIIAGGVGSFEPRKLTLKQTEKFEGKSIFYSVKNKDSFKNKIISIFGGGDSALDWALELSKYSKINLIHRRNEFRGAPRNSKNG